MTETLKTTEPTIPLDLMASGAEAIAEKLRNRVSESHGIISHGDMLIAAAIFTAAGALHRLASAMEKKSNG